MRWRQQARSGQAPQLFYYINSPGGAFSVISFRRTTICVIDREVNSFAWCLTVSIRDCCGELRSERKRRCE